MLSKARKDKGLAMSEFVNTGDKPGSSEASKSSTTELSEVSSAPLSHSSIHHEARMKNGNTERKQREKERSPSLQKHRLSETSKATKDHRSEVKPKVGARRNNNMMMRKSVKDTVVGSSSGVGHLGYVAVGVASWTKQAYISHIRILPWEEVTITRISKIQWLWSNTNCKCRALPVRFNIWHVCLSIVLMKNHLRAAFHACNSVFPSILCMQNVMWHVAE